MNWKKIAFYFIWFVLLALGPFTILKNTPLDVLLTGSRIIQVNFIQRVLGLTAFTMLFTQIILGAFMPKWIEKLGGWIFKFHITEGLIAYALVVLHPLMFFLFNYFIYQSLDIFYIFVDICILCKPPIEYFYSLGRLAFWLLTISVSAALFRTATPFMRIHWKKFHMINYLTFLVIWTHSLGVGSDIGTFPFSIFHGPALVIIVWVTIWQFRHILPRFTGSK